MSSISRRRLFSSVSSLSQFGGVHGNQTGKNKLWRNKPLLRRDGDKIFKTGTEAVQLLFGEASRRDNGDAEFLESWESLVGSLGVVFERMPKYAWVMKQLLEPERSISFRVAWIDDDGVSRVNRGYRVQYSSALGPYEGGTMFGSRCSTSSMKAFAFDTTFSNALALKNFGGAYGGSDFLPDGKSDNEIQRFCQSYMTELSKYIGAELDLPGFGDGVQPMEIAYMYGQYKRTTMHCGQVGQGLLWGGNSKHFEPAKGLGVVYFAKRMLEAKGMSLEGKKCLITGSNPTALAVAQKLMEFGAIPVSFSDSKGNIYEPQGFDMNQLKTIKKIKQDRGATIGRYIIASTTCKFNEPENILSIPCDLVFPCDHGYALNEADVSMLATNGCKGIIEGAHRVLSLEGIKAAKKKGLMHGPYRASCVADSLFNGMTVSKFPLKEGETVDNRVEEAMNNIYDEVVATAKEFNARGDLNAGTNITAFLRVANVMLNQGSV